MKCGIVPETLYSTTLLISKLDISILFLLLSGKTFEKKKKKGLIPQMDSAQIVIFVFTTKSRITWAKVHIFSDSRYMDS